MLVPPSVALIIYGMIAEVSIGKMLISGILPAVVVTATIIGTISFLVYRDPRRAPPSVSVPWRLRFHLLMAVAPMLVLFSGVMAVLFTGIATPTEASALGALGSIILAIIRKKLSPKIFLRSVQRAGVTTCMIFMIIMGAAIFGYAFTMTGATQKLVALIYELGLSRWLVIILIIMLLIVLGTFMDQMAILVLVVPIALPIVIALGFDPIWFGVIVVVAAELGMVTPPVGLNCFVVARYADRPVVEVFGGTFPHFIAHLIAIAILVAFPIISLWLPSMM